MIYTYPDYYKKFSCIADKCPDTCCGKWQIVIDDDSLERYQEYDGDTDRSFTGKGTGKRAFSGMAEVESVHFCEMTCCVICIYIWVRKAFVPPAGNIRDIRKNSRMCARFRYHFHVLRWHVY